MEELEREAERKPEAALLEGEAVQSTQAHLGEAVQVSTGIDDVDAPASRPDEPEISKEAVSSEADPKRVVPEASGVLPVVDGFLAAGQKELKGTSRGVEGKRSGSATVDCGEESTDDVVPTQALSDMPPPSSLPKPLRTRRNNSLLAKAASSSPHTHTLPTASGVSHSFVCSKDEASPDLKGKQAGAEPGQPDREAGPPAASPTVPGKDAKVDEEFVLFMKEIQQLDSQREADSAAEIKPQSEAAAEAQQQKQQQPEGNAPPSADSPPGSLAIPAIAQSSQLQQHAADWQAVVDAASGKTYYWNVATDEVVWEMPKEYSCVKAPPEERREQQQQDLHFWTASTFKLTQELQTCAEKVHELMLQLDFIDEELNSVEEQKASTEAACASKEANVPARLQRFRNLKRQREHARRKRLEEARVGGADDELLKDLIDLHLQQDRQLEPGQCARCKQRNAESRGTQHEQAEIRSLASSLARRLGNVEKEWAAAMLAALKARLDDWIDGGLAGSFFLQRLEKMQKEFQKHLVQDVEAEGRQQDLASAFPYSSAAAAMTANVASKVSPRNCLASAVVAASAERASSSRSLGSSRSAAAAPEGGKKSSGDPSAACSAPPTPSGPPPTPPNGVHPYAPDAAEAEPAAAAAADSSRHRPSDPTATASRDGAQHPSAPGAANKRASSTAASKRLTSSNPLVRKRMQLVEKWQKSREKGEESEEEDYEQRRERQKQRKLEEWKEREMASHRGMKNANFIEVTADWRTLVEKK